MNVLPRSIVLRKIRCGFAIDLSISYCKGARPAEASENAHRVGGEEPPRI